MILIPLSFAFVLVVSDVAAAAGILVPGSANPNLAGRADGYTCCEGDSVPGQSPVLVQGVDLHTCGILTILASGKVSFGPDAPSGDNPDGDEAFDMTNYGDGISAPTDIRTNALVGVFLGDASPTGMPTPAQLDIGDSMGTTYFRPLPGQIFFIGDGRNSDSKTDATDGPPQAFFVPAGATRLYLGTTDGVGWFNNSGSFAVSVTSMQTLGGFDCGDAAMPDGITATDSLHVLRAAVGSVLCIDCVCDVDRSGAIVASDALAVLRHAVGQNVPMLCECCPPLE